MIEQTLIRNLEEPFNRDPQGEIHWVCESLGFYESMDKQKTAAAVFTRILERARTEEGVTTTELIDEFGLSRVALLNHLKKLIAAGLVVQDANTYRLRAGNLYRTIREVRRDLDRVLEDIEDVSREIDVSLGLKRRHQPLLGE